jgi:hypothetical protein
MNAPEVKQRCGKGLYLHRLYFCSLALKMIFNRIRRDVTAVGLVSFLVFLALNSSLVAPVSGGVSGFYMESLVMSVDCDSARLDLACTLTSTNTSLIHYPAPVNLNDAHLVECGSVAVTFSMVSTMLTFQFNGTDETAARSNADAMIPSMNTAFGATFTHYATYPVSLPYPYVVVIYQADPKSNLATFLADLKGSCFSPDVGGFSNVLPTLFSHAENATIIITALNYTTDWSHTFIAEYDTAFPAGSGSHTVDILYCLGASGLQPSQYAWLGIYYISYVTLTVDSSEALSFTSCVPSRVFTPLASAGWYVPQEAGNTISGTLSFGNSIPAWETITFTFEGNIVPEFSGLTSILLIAFASAMLLYLRKHSRTIA